MWDGEEPGLLGSTEWVEDHAKELQEHAVAYINSDNNERGFLYAGGSHTLEKFFTQIAFSVKDPEKGISVGQRRLDAATLREGKPLTDFHIDALGSGSDYTPFLQHLGIASMDLGFGGEGGGGEYHTDYDDYIDFTRFKDPGFHYEKALVEVAGISVLRLANADILPFDFTHFYKTVDGYVNEVQLLANTMREKTQFQNQMIKDSIYEKVEDPTKIFVVPKKEAPVPYFNFASLKNAMVTLQQSADAYANMFKTLEEHPDENTIRKINSMVYKSERYLTSEQGLPGRPWYKHMIYAPGFYTGYGVKTIPGVREAIEQREYIEVEQQTELLSKTLNGFSSYINEMVNIQK